MFCVLARAECLATIRPACEVPRGPHARCGTVGPRCQQLRNHPGFVTMESPELAVIGLTCNVVGVFFLANSIRFREPRKALEDVLGVGGLSLLKIRDTALNTMQVILGFLFLTTGFLLQIVAQWDMELTTLAFCVGIIAVAGAVYAVGAYSSRRAFRRLLREFFQSQQWSFQDDMELTKEIGEVMGVPHGKDMTVEAYVHRVRQALGVTVPPKPTSAAERARRIALPGR